MGWLKSYNRSEYYNMNERYLSWKINIFVFIYYRFFYNIYQKKVPKTKNMKQKKKRNNLENNAHLCTIVIED
jgi:hypothetical protein